MLRPRRRVSVALPLFDQPGTPTAPPPVVDVDTLHRLVCARYGVTPEETGHHSKPTRYPLRCAWPVACSFVTECGCVLSPELRTLLREESTP